MALDTTQVLLTDIRMDGVGYSTASLKAPFCLSGPTGSVSLCYVVRRAPVWLEVESPRHKTVLIQPGSVVGLSGIVPHWFKSGPDVPLPTERPLRLTPLDANTRFDGSVDLLVGHVPLETLAFTNTLVGAVIVPPDGGHVARRMKAAVEAIEDELRVPDPAGGSSSVVRRLSEIILMNFARWSISNGTDNELALGALADVRIMRAIGAAARAPLEPWTVARMAAVAGMSRTAFAMQFQRLTGDTPLHMLAHFRLRLAAEALSNGNRRLEEVAVAAGYSSAAAFNRAFRRFYRTTPAKWRSARFDTR